MINHDSPEAAKTRANQEDPIIMYLVVRESLNMSIGKTAAQCAHASQMLLLKYHKFMITDHSNSTELPPFSREKYNLFTEWLHSSFRKVVLKADDKEWKKLKEEFLERERVVVIDAGFTEVEPGSETCIGLLPMHKSKVSKLIKRLQLLK